MANNILTSANRRRESSSIALVVIVLGSQDRIDAWEEAVIGCFGFGEIGEIALKIINRNREIDYRGEKGCRRSV